MKTDLKKAKLAVQETLDELFSENLIPFKLHAYKVEPLGLGEYLVPFCDSRLHSIRFDWANGQSLKETVRAAVRDRVSRMSGPLRSFWLASLDAHSPSLHTAAVTRF
jgi:hypothetical protein